MTETPNKTLYLGRRGFPQADFLLVRWQVWALVLLAVVLAGMLAWLGPARTFIAVNAVFAVFFLAGTVYRFYLIDLSLQGRHQLEVKPEELVEPPGGWPRYVVQVPLYKERHALPHLVKALSRLDYPADRLNIQLLVEEDDAETRQALAEVTIVPPFTVVYVPVSHPRTKPKACNVGLAAAEGEFLVVFDAEDRPDPDQLKKAVIAFGRCAPNVACVQAKLNFYNARRNLLTRCFTAEYSMWFDLCLPGLDRLRAPIPLGGTSNHFKLAVLQELKGWDEFNVTEDCDLGLRLFQAGYRTRILDSTTWEEACPRVFPWIRQRSRWVKGYIQTYIVQTRRPWELSRRLGWRNSVHFHLLLGGSVLAQLLSTFYWLLVLVWIAFRPELVGQFFPGPVFFMAALSLFVGNFGMVYCAALASIRTGFGSVARYSPILVLYWIMMSVAAWRGALQLLWSPHYWEKTQHHTL